MSRWRRTAPSLIFALAILVLWEASVDFFRVPDILLPAPSEVIAGMVTSWPLYFRHTWPTLSEILLGYAIATILGTLCGMVIAFSRLLGNAIYPALVATQIMPKVAFAPLLVVWFGFGLTPKLILVALIAFFPIVINTVVALNMTMQESLYLFRSMGASAIQTFFKLRLPAALPVYFAGLKIAATFSIVGVVVAEFYSSDRGLGYLLLIEVSNGDTTRAFGSIAYLTILGLIAFGSVALIERLLVPAHMLKRFDESPAARASS
jgi:ABC-type nitrate/sulfonate/bicarbonate transport system permease component